MIKISMRFNFVTKFYVQYRSEEISPQNSHFSQWSGASVPLSISWINSTPVTYEPLPKMVLSFESILCQISISLVQGDTKALACHLASEHKATKDENKNQGMNKNEPKGFQGETF